MTEELLARLLDRVEHRYYGKYRALVADNADPENRGRLRLRIPSVLGNDVVSGWALPCLPYGGAAGCGFFFIPEKDDGVWAEFEAGNLDYPIWVGSFWSKPGGTTEVPDPAGSQSPPTSKVIKTLKHVIELADEDQKETIRIEDVTNGNNVVIDKNGIAVEDANGNKVTLDSSGIVLEAASGSKATMDSSGIVLDGKTIKIGAGAGEPLLLGDTLVNTLDQWFQTIATHMHTGNLGAPTTPPLPPFYEPLVLKTARSKHKVE